jgi:ADP-ribosylglycohydrolase
MSSPAVSLPPDHAARLDRARLSLDGLSVGDAFGEQFFFYDLEEQLIRAERPFPQAPWPYTDDSEMALGIFDVLGAHGHVDQDALAHTFARRYTRNPGRGYGATAHTILQQIGKGKSWRQASSEAFDGQGSMGNGAAMRVAPLGAYFADDLARVRDEALASAAVTHGHPEGVAGGIAIAVAAAWAWRVGTGQETHAPGRLIEVALDHTPPGETRAGIERAQKFSLRGSPIAVARVLGSGYRVTSPDTVPFTLWCAERHLTDYVEAMWTTVAGLGDRDTTCAIVGGIVALAAGASAIPEEWRAAREALNFGV